MTRAPRCKIGESKARETARKAYAKACRRKDVGTISNPIGSLPAPPPPGSPDAAKCMESWMECYNLAKQIDDTRKLIAALKLHYESIKFTIPASPERTKLLAYLANLINATIAKENQLVTTLQYQTAHYLDCMNGMRT